MFPQPLYCPRIWNFLPRLGNQIGVSEIFHNLISLGTSLSRSILKSGAGQSNIHCSNDFFLRGRAFFKMISSLRSSIINSSPARNWCRARTSAGMTTCPLLLNLVVTVRHYLTTPLVSIRDRSSASFPFRRGLFFCDSALLCANESCVFRRGHAAAREKLAAFWK